MVDQRLPEHRRPEALEQELRFFEQILEPVESELLTEAPQCEDPVLFIMGCARSGTTLIYQYLAQAGLFAYPTNFLSRFYYAPYLGARLQRMLFDLDFRGEIKEHGAGTSFESDLGKTLGVGAPHEFWYFWRRFFRFGEEQQLDVKALAASDGWGFMKELRALQSVFARPLVLKGMILNWNIPYLASLDERHRFLFIERGLTDNAGSLLSARRRFFGDERSWYSFKPPGHARVRNLEPAYQTVWQVMATNSAIHAGLAQVPGERVFHTTYEQFCENPRCVLDNLSLRWQRPLPQIAKVLPVRFERRSPAMVSDIDWSRIVPTVREDFPETRSPEEAGCP